MKEKKFMSDVRLGGWSKDDIKQLRRLYQNSTTAYVAELLGRTTEAVKKMASRLGIKKSRKFCKANGIRYSG